MSEKERQQFAAIVAAEVNSYQAAFIDGLVKHNDSIRAPLSERCADPAICRLWARR